VVKGTSAGDGSQRSHHLKRIIQQGQRLPAPARATTDTPKSTPPDADPPPARRWDLKCTGGPGTLRQFNKCRRVPTREFREWKEREKIRRMARDAASEE